MTYVAVSPTRTSRGVHAPGVLGKSTRVSSPTYDWREDPGSVGNTEAITADYQVADIYNALHAVYRTDAMFVCYLLRHEGRTFPVQPRICIDAIPWLTEQGYSIGLDCLAADCDLRGADGGKRAWTPSILDIVSAKLATMPTAGFFVSPHGARIVQPLERTVDASVAGSVVEAWLTSLSIIECVGDGWNFCVDFKAKDWTRHSAPPNSLRNGSVYHSPLIRLDRMTPIKAPIGKRAVSYGSSRLITGITFARSTPPQYHNLVLAVAKPFLDNGYKGSRHDYFLATVGALLKKGVEPSAVPAVAIDIAKTAKLDVSRARKDAADTTYRYLQGMRVTGMMKLPPELQIAIEGRVVKTTTHRQSKQQAQAELEDTIRKAPLGLTLIQTPCGFGKTTAAMAVAAERALVSPDKLRAPPQTKTAIAEPTHQKAQDLVDRFRANGIPVKRLFGLLSVKDESGHPVCRFAKQARALQQGGQSIAWELCEGRKVDPCPYKATCLAYCAEDADDHARVYVGPHAMIAQLDKAAGASGLLVIDETPALTTCHVLRLSDLQSCQLGHFEDRYAVVMMVVIGAVVDWIQRSDINADATMKEILDSVDPSLKAAALEALELEELPEISHAPPIKDGVVALMRQSEAVAAVVGKTSKTLRALGDMILSDVSRISLRELDERAIVATVVPRNIRDALTRQGSAVMLDAGMSTNKPMVDAIVGHDVPLKTFSVADGTQIKRTIIYTQKAKRSQWLHSEDLIRLVRAAVNWILEDPSMADVAIVSTKAVEDRLGEAMATREGALWQELSRLSRPPELGHYHALRGLDVWSELDAIVTIGDPYANLDAVQHDALIAGQDRDDLVKRRAQDELEQAHGRLRVIHRQRPGRLCHVGGIVPSGWEEWESRAI